MAEFVARMRAEKCTDLKQRDHIENHDVNRNMKMNDKEVRCDGVQCIV
jgi:hypothetical protein